MIKLASLIKENWEVKDGKVLSNGKLVGYYEFNRDSDSFWVDDVNKGKGQLSFETKKEVENYFKKNERDALKHLEKQRGLRESISEAIIHPMKREGALDNLREVILNIKPYSREVVKHCEAAIKIIEKFDAK